MPLEKAVMPSCPQRLGWEVISCESRRDYQLNETLPAAATPYEERKVPGGVIFKTLRVAILAKGETGLRVLPDQLLRPRIRCIKNVMCLRRFEVSSQSAAGGSLLSWIMLTADGRDLKHAESIFS